MVTMLKWLPIITAMMLTVSVGADPPPAATQPRPQAPVPTVALLTFQSSLTQPENSGELLAEILSGRLGAVDGITVVERREIARILAEQKLALSGLVSGPQAARVGKLLGAQLLVTGRVVDIGSNVLVICRVISAETSQVKGVFLELPADAPFVNVVNSTAAQLADALPRLARQLIPEDERGPRDAERLRALLQDNAAPAIAVIIKEAHPAALPIDPVVETEFKMLLTQAGIQPVALMRLPPQSTSSEAERGPALTQMLTGVQGLSSSAKNDASLRQLLTAARYLIWGEASSESGGIVEGLNVGLARAEVQVIDLQTKTILVADRSTGRAADLSESLAAKTALQKAGRDLAMKVLPRLLQQLPPSPKPDAAKEETGTPG